MKVCAFEYGQDFNKNAFIWCFMLFPLFFRQRDGVTVRLYQVLRGAQTIDLQTDPLIPVLSIAENPHRYVTIDKSGDTLLERIEHSLFWGQAGEVVHDSFSLI